MRAGMLREQPQAAAEAILRLRHAGEPVVHQAEAVMRLGKRRIEQQRLALELLGFLQGAGGHAGQAEIGPGRGEIRAALQGGAVVRLRGGDLAGQMQGEAALQAGAGVVLAHGIGHVGPSMPAFSS